MRRSALPAGPAAEEESSPRRCEPAHCAQQCQLREARSSEIGRIDPCTTDSTIDAAFAAADGATPGGATLHGPTSARESPGVSR